MQTELINIRVPIDLMKQLKAIEKTKPGMTRTDVILSILKDALLSDKPNRGPPTGQDFQALTDQLVFSHKLTEEALEIAKQWHNRYDIISRKFTEDFGGLFRVLTMTPDEIAKMQPEDQAKFHAFISEVRGMARGLERSGKRRKEKETS